MRTLFLISAILFTGIAIAQTEVTFYTNQGDFTVELHDSLMPVTTTNFKGLVNNKGYDGKQFYRVVVNFVIQGGYRTGTPPPIPDEFDSTGSLSNRRWTLSMANSGPNTGSSEFFINLKDNLFLDYDKAPLTSAHPVFGTLSSGWTVVSNIGQVAVNANDQPINPVIMDSLRITSTGLSNRQIIANQSRSSVYPNPISTESVLDLYCRSGGTAKVQLLDTQGRLLHQTQQEVRAGKNIIRLRSLGVRNLNYGIYFLQVGLSDGIQVFRLQKTK